MTLNYLTAPLFPRQDAHGRSYVIYNGRRYLVPANGHNPEMEPCCNWWFHERHRLAIPASFQRYAAKRPPHTRYEGPRDHDGGSDIITIPAESLAAATMIAAVLGLRVFGWDIENRDGRDCTGQTFSSPADTFVVCRDSGEHRRVRETTYGFRVQWFTDV